MAEVGESIIIEKSYSSGVTDLITPPDSGMWRITFLALINDNGGMENQQLNIVPGREPSSKTRGYSSGSPPIGMSQAYTDGSIDGLLFSQNKGLGIGIYDTDANYPPWTVVINGTKVSK